MRKVITAREQAERRAAFYGATQDDHPGMDWANIPATAPGGARWYHVSPNKLEPGTDLSPGGGQSAWDQDYSMFGADARRNHVWLEHNPYKLHRWIRPDGKQLAAPYVYEVEPSTPPRPWNNTGAYGWVTPSAKIKRLINSEGRVMRYELFPEEDPSNTQRTRTATASLNDYLYHYAARTDAYDLDFRDQPPDQTPVRPGPWYHSTNAELAPGTVLDATQPNQFNYSDSAAPRDDWVFMHHQPAATEVYGPRVYEVEPLDEGPYAYNGEDEAYYDGYVSPRARVVREIVHPRPKESIDFADAMSRMAALERTAMPTDQTLVDRLRFEHTDFGDGGGAVNAFDPDHPESPGYVGTLGWHPDGKISDVWTPDEKYRHRGVATAILDHARSIRPDIHHSDLLSEAGQQWAKSDPLYVEHPNRQQIRDDTAQQLLYWDQNKHEPWLADDKSQRNIDLFNKGQHHDVSPGVKDFSDAMSRMAAVPGEIHRGLTLDLDSPKTSPQLRQVLQTYGPESPEFIQELLRNGTGTYWSRDRGFAEGVNPGNGLQVALSADWDGNDAQQLHPELTRDLPDSWGDMSLLAPQENAVSEFNIKPNKELNVKSIRVRKKGDPSWREILRQPVRAKTAGLFIAMPQRDAWDTRYTDPGSDSYLPNSRRDIGNPVVDAPMWHATDRQYDVGDIITPNKGYFPSQFNDYYERSGNGDRQNWVWMDDPETVGNQWGKGNEQWVYEVEPLDEGPYPWNGQDAAGYVAPRARVKSVVKQRTAPPPRWQSPVKMRQRLIGPQPPDPNEHEDMARAAALTLGMAAEDAYDPGEYYEGADENDFWEQQGAAPDTKGPWWHSTTMEYQPGDIIEPSHGYAPSVYADMYDENGQDTRQDWVWMDRPADARTTWARPGNNVYEVEPLDEGPHPWNGDGFEGHVSPRARVIRHVHKVPGLDSQADLARQRFPGPMPPVHNVPLDKVAMVLGMCSIEQLTQLVREGIIHG